MMGIAKGSPKLPPLSMVADVLRATTEDLALELAHPKPAPPEWSEFEWRTARAVASMHGISGLLAGQLHWRGPEGWVEFLCRQREHITRRQVRIQALVGAIGERFSHDGIPVQPLKGAALYREGIYCEGQRPMADLDLLTLPAHAVGAGKILETLGLHESHRTFKHRIFEAHDATPPRSFGEHADNYLKVELHE